MGILCQQKGGYYFQKGSAEIYIPTIFIFRKEMSTYFSDCDRIVKKIELKEYGKKMQKKL